MPAYRLLTPAQYDLIEITNYLADNASPRVALRYESDFREAFRQLAKRPRIGHSRTNLASRDILFFLVDPYLIAYRIESEGIVILAVVHAAQDVKRIISERPI